MVCHLISLQPILKQEKEFPWKLFQTAEHQEILRNKRVGPGNAKRYRGRPTYIKGASYLQYIYLPICLFCGRQTLLFSKFSSPSFRLCASDSQRRYIFCATKIWFNKGLWNIYRRLPQWNSPCWFHQSWRHFWRRGRSSGKPFFTEIDVK